MKRDYSGERCVFYMGYRRFCGSARYPVYPITWDYLHIEITTITSHGDPIEPYTVIVELRRRPGRAKGAVSVVLEV
jgi:hypothetical protein